MENLVNSEELTVAVLIIAYRREETTRLVLQAVRQARPQRLYIACNAPRPEKNEEAGQCHAVRQLFDGVDWPCEVHRLFREQHLCARDSIAGAISWFFETETMGIILEDDCVPAGSFFKFAESLLRKYADDKRVGMISGNNFQYGRRYGNDSYYWSHYCHIWGWATWKDRWTDYDASMKDWCVHGNNVLNQLQNPLERRYWQIIFKRTHDGEIDTWDYQWLFCNWLNHRLNIVPQQNLVKNIGFGEQAHHTKTHTRAADMDTAEIEFPLRHPSAFIACTEADSYTFWSGYLLTALGSIWRKAVATVKARFPTSDRERNG